MKLKQLGAEAVVAAGLGLPVGLSIGVANAAPPSPPPVPTPPPNYVSGVQLGEPPTRLVVPPNLATAMANGDKVEPTTTATPFTGTPLTSFGTPAVQTGLGTAMATSGEAVPATTAAPFGGEAPRFSSGTGLNRRGSVARQLRLEPLVAALLRRLGGLPG